MSSTLYQPLADEKSEISGCRTPPPSSSWWARSSTTTKLMVVGGAIASSMLVMGVGMNTCLSHEAPMSKHLVARGHHPHGRPSITTTSSSAAAAATSDDSDYSYSDDSYSDDEDYAAATTIDPVATIAAITSSYGSAPVAMATRQAAVSSSEPAAASTSESAAASTSKPAAASATAAAPSAAAVSASSGTLWQPPVKASWQIILNHVLDVSALSTSVAPDVDVFDIDLFDNPKETFDALKRLGKKSICYFSAGSYEPNRSDSGDFASSDKGAELDGWPGEYWLNLNSANVRSIMTKRIELAASKGCDAIDPDNVDAYGNTNGLGMTQADSIDYIKFLSTTAAAHGMSTGLKNGGDIVESVLDHVHFSVNEQCAQYSECDVFNCMINAGKPVFHIEYPDEVTDLTRDALCAAGTMGSSFSTVLKTLELDGYVQTCSSGVPGIVASTALLS